MPRCKCFRHLSSPDFSLIRKVRTYLSLVKLTAACHPLIPSLHSFLVSPFAILSPLTVPLISCIFYIFLSRLGKKKKIHLHILWLGVTYVRSLVRTFIAGVTLLDSRNNILKLFLIIFFYITSFTFYYHLKKKIHFKYRRKELLNRNSIYIKICQPQKIKI
jgi:hypothetical protein